MQTLSFSQTSYPKKILWENDTLLAITKPQLIKINRTLNEWTYLRRVNERLYMELSLLDSLNGYWKGTANTFERQYLIETQKTERLIEENSHLQTSLENKKKKSRKINIGVGVGGTLIGILLGVLLGK